MNTMTATGTVLGFADLTLDTATGRTTRGGHAIPLTPSETRLLELLLRTPGEPVSIAQVQRALWGETPRSMSTLGMFVLTLRRKLEAHGAGRLVHTLHGFGFVLSETPPEPWHGTDGGYSNRACRCRACRDANAAAQRRRREQRVRNTPFELIPHGENGYGNYGCKCRTCRDGHAAARRKGARR